MPENREMKASELVNFIQKYELEEFSVIDCGRYSLMVLHEVIKADDPYICKKVIIDKGGNYKIMEIIDDPNSLDEVVKIISRGNILEENRAKIRTLVTVRCPDCNRKLMEYIREHDRDPEDWESLVCDKCGKFFPRWDTAKIIEEPYEV